MHHVYIVAKMAIDLYTLCTVKMFLICSNCMAMLGHLLKHIGKNYNVYIYLYARATHTTDTYM